MRDATCLTTTVISIRRRQKEFWQVRNSVNNTAYAERVRLRCAWLATDMLTQVKR